MHIEVQWLTQRGTKTADNRDYAGVGIRSDKLLAIVVDGSTKGEKNGEYAEAIVRNFVDWFVETQDPILEKLIIEQLRLIRERLLEHFPSCSASVLIVVIVPDNDILIMHIGDCVIGRLDDKNNIVWHTDPHTLANVITKMTLDELATTVARHLLTRSLRTQEFMAPDVTFLELSPGGYLMATDGYWADLALDEQLKFKNGHFPDDESAHDDRSVLNLKLEKINDPGMTCIFHDNSENLYTAVS